MVGTKALEEGGFGEDTGTAKYSLEFGNCQTNPFQNHSSQNINDDILATESFNLDKSISKAVFPPGGTPCG